MNNDYIALYNNALIARGDLASIVKATKAIDKDIEPYVFEFESCKRIDLNWHGDEKAVLASLQEEQPTTTGKRGRPKLGVKSKEVTLLPRHWQWLAMQRGGASVTLRRLVDEAMKNPPIEQQIKLKQNQLYNLLSVMADEPGFENASRALYRNELSAFETAIQSWSKDIAELLIEKFNEIVHLQQGKHDDR
ncbi:hypothetical protein tinsulaeT_04690 [Thalassotalea insulae]|uniref:DUF2239 family protein n=1 Tax=Thalassotalea insulae TaxID=2056778 RepID=A0ABQ6GNJ4_9GAMM|nr:DUF2239 family protein [Thalassotalea insulae]GLX77129.1 hypothetical protein tinsulaeT_04690 [Thalassotalea insulae]